MPMQFLQALYGSACTVARRCCRTVRTERRREKMHCVYEGRSSDLLCEMLTPPF